jgi:hypothetical protein
MWGADRQLSVRELMAEYPFAQARQKVSKGLK